MPSPFNPGSFRFSPVGLEAKKAAVRECIAGSKQLISVRTASRLEARAKPEMLRTGIAELDAITGGIPRGRLTEICGPASSGKTSVLVSTLATASRRSESCALIDASDSFDPQSGAAAGLNFQQLLWIRLSDPPVSVKASLAGSLRKLEQVLRVTDLLLESGGFGLIALDLAGVEGGFVRRIPLASWFRFVRTVEHTKTTLLVLSELPCAGTCAALVIHLSPNTFVPKAQLSGTPTHGEIMEGLRVKAEVVRSRLERKPMQSVKTILRTEAIRA
jgi:hypothetical protein